MYGLRQSIGAIAILSELNACDSTLEVSLGYKDSVTVGFSAEACHPVISLDDETLRESLSVRESRNTGDLDYDGLIDCALMKLVGL